MRFLLAEYWHTHIYAEPFFQRFPELGVEVEAFRGQQFFLSDAKPLRLLRRAEDKFRFGPAVLELNASLVDRVRRTRPDVVFVFRGEHVLPSTLARIKKLGSHVIGWHNDDPLSDRYPSYVWRHFLRGIPNYDHLFAYRHTNLEAFRARGCPRVSLLRSFYLRQLNHVVTGEISTAFRSDVSFIGHWENDGRDAYIGALLNEPGIDFRLWGTLWDRSACAAALAARFGAVRPLYKADYNLALNGTRIAIAFLSKLNHDTYTRRCFEIPAAGTFMLSEYTDDLASMFEPGKEAEYFRSSEELLEKVRFYLGHDDARRRIAEAGRARLLRDGHEAADRARQVLETVKRDLGCT
ncbi:MAG: glycosyltransferase [Deltaproteobacteria bacterium]|nr:glycosyltransferase [Deltaproteobacteria bacterium]